MIFDYQKPILERLVQGNLPAGFDLYSKADINDLCPTINAIPFLCPGRAGHTLIFEVNEDGKTNDTLR